MRAGEVGRRRGVVEPLLPARGLLGVERDRRPLLLEPLRGGARDALALRGRGLGLGSLLRRQRRLLARGAGITRGLLGAALLLPGDFRALLRRGLGGGARVGRGPGARRRRRARAVGDGASLARGGAQPLSGLVQVERLDLSLGRGAAGEARLARGPLRLAPGLRGGCGGLRGEGGGLSGLGGELGGLVEVGGLLRVGLRGGCFFFVFFLRQRRE